MIFRVPGGNAIPRREYPGCCIHSRNNGRNIRKAAATT